MRITFALPEINLSGGVKIALEYAHWLQSRGHDVTCVYPRPRRSRALKYVADLFMRRQSLRVDEESSHLWGKKLKIVQGREHSTLRVTDFPEADVVISTWWETAEWTSTLPENKGAKAYFVQDHEVFPGLPLDRVQATYRSRSTKIVVSVWLARIMSSLYEQTSVIVENGVDLGRFFPRPNARRAHQIGVVWSAAERKNSAMAIEAMKLVRQKIPTLRATIFGGERRPRELERLGWIDYHVCPQQELIPELYSRCSVWLFPSLSEGFGLPLLEALASGTPVVATKAGAAPELIDSSNGRLVEYCAQNMADAAVDILTLSAFGWRAMSENARKTGEQHDWTSAAREFEAALTAIAVRA
ncbi:MAG: glycosyltransferase family 4 protein [Patescibacteria group bacterium]